MPTSEAISLPVPETARKSITTLLHDHRPLVVALASLLIVVLGVLGFRTQLQSLVSRGKLDSARVVVLPFRGNATAGEALKRGFEDVWSDWQDLHVISDAELAEVLPRGSIPRSLSEARELAKKLGARRIVWGEIYATKNASTTRVELYDLAEDGQSPPRTAFLANSVIDRPTIAKTSFALLKDPQRPSLADGGDGGTRSLAAWTAYGRGHLALVQWNLTEAARAFTAAVDSDPAYAAAGTWLAQVLEWTRYQNSDWQAHANHAEEGIGQLPAPDRLVAAAVAALARSDFPVACARYRELTQAVSASFIGWYGLGECQCRKCVPHVREGSSARAAGACPFDP